MPGHPMARVKKSDISKRLPAAEQKKAHLAAGKMRVNAFENLHPAAPTSKLPGVAHAMEAGGLIRHYGIHIAGNLIIINHFDA